MPVIVEKSGPPEGAEYTLHLWFRHGPQIEVQVTKFEPKRDEFGRILYADIEQGSLFPGDYVAAHIDWREVAFAAISWDPEKERG
jgi:hypothetical protein